MTGSYMTDEQMQICEFHYRGTCAINREPEFEKFRKDGVVFAEIVVNADPCDREFCPFQRDANSE